MDGWVDGWMGCWEMGYALESTSDWLIIRVTLPYCLGNSLLSCLAKASLSGRKNRICVDWHEFLPTVGVEPFFRLQLSSNPAVHIQGFQDIAVPFRIISTSNAKSWVFLQLYTRASFGRMKKDDTFVPISSTVWFLEGSTLYIQSSDFYLGDHQLTFLGRVRSSKLEALLRKHLCHWLPHRHFTSSTFFCYTPLLLNIFSSISYYLYEMLAMKASIESFLSQSMLGSSCHSGSISILKLQPFQHTTWPSQPAY